jgi:phage terminase large subunit-like protein
MITCPPPESGDRVVQSWDTASKAGELLNDYSVCTTRVGEGHGLHGLLSAKCSAREA